MQAEGQVSMNATALALYEWMHESDLADAGLLGAPIEVAPQVGHLLFLCMTSLPSFTSYILLHNYPSQTFVCGLPATLSIPQQRP